MRPYLFILTLAAATTAFSQQPVTAHSSPILSGNCPVSLSAAQQAKGAVMWTTALEDAHNPRQGGDFGVHVELKAQLDKTIQQVELLVHYTPQGLHLMPVTPGSDNTSTSDSVKTYDLTGEKGYALTLTGYLRLGSVASINRVSIASIHYTDGTTWEPGAHQKCSVDVSHVMLVNQK